MNKNVFDDVITYAVERNTPYIFSKASRKFRESCSLAVLLIMVLNILEQISIIYIDSLEGTIKGCVNFRKLPSK